jgi:phosphate transport system permease protein
MRKAVDKLLTGFAWVCGLGVIALVAGIVVFLCLRGWHTLGPRLLFGDVPWWQAVSGQRPVFDGLWPAVVGTVCLTLGSAAVAVPSGIAAGIYLAEYAGGRWLRRFSMLIDLLAAVPSVVMGLFGFGMILFLRRTILPAANTCLLLSIGCIALLVLPYLIRTTETALRALPPEMRLLGPSLGLSQWQSVWRIRLPAASRGILSGVILAVGRAAEDTAVILLTGVVANAGVIGGLTAHFEALPFAIYYLAAEHRSPDELDRAFGAALMLLALTAALFALAAWIEHSLHRRGRPQP